MNAPFAITCNCMMTASNLAGSMLFLQMAVLVNPGFAQDNVSYQANDLIPIEAPEPAAVELNEPEDTEGQQSASQELELELQDSNINLPQLNSEADPDSCMLPGVLVALCATF